MELMICTALILESTRVSWRPATEQRNWAVNVILELNYGVE